MIGMSTEDWRAVNLSNCFNHGIGEILTALTNAGLSLTAFEEHRELPWNPFDDAMVASPDHPGEVVLAEQPERLPLTSTWQAVKR